MQIARGFEKKFSRFSPKTTVLRGFTGGRGVSRRVCAGKLCRRRAEPEPSRGFYRSPRQVSADAPSAHRSAGHGSLRSGALAFAKIWNSAGLQSKFAAMPQKPNSQRPTQKWPILLCGTAAYILGTLGEIPQTISYPMVPYRAANSSAVIVSSPSRPISVTISPSQTSSISVTSIIN